jgi:ubiquinone/menaquinone biosynthesis C-methylase UbiE
MRCMKLNRVEMALMNNPLRAFVQRQYEARLLQRLGGRTNGLRVLEVGCGRGVGTQILLDRFGAAEVHAFDLDPAMVALAQERLAAYPPGRLRLAVGDVTAIDAPDAHYDAVFDFGIIHHVPDWPQAVAEVARVLRPGGRFFFEEVTRHALERWSYRTFLEHPKENRFSAEEFVRAVERCGVTVGDRWVTRFFGDFVIGVGTRTS